MQTSLDWDDALNARYALPGLIRSANLSFLSGQGRAALLASGVSRVIDLRARAERQTDPAPFAGAPEDLNLPLLPERHAEIGEVHATGQTNADFYRVYLDHAGNQLAAIFGAMHDAPPGLLLIHCHAGKARTGLVAALAQKLCGLTREEVAADYAETDRHLGQFYAGQLERQPDLEMRARLATLLVSRPHDVVAALEHLDRHWGGAESYLEAFGMNRAEQHQLAARLQNPTALSSA
ncbi:tyrosine-protein phosphatase [Deinococcus sp. UYEF24]